MSVASLRYSPSLLPRGLNQPPEIKMFFPEKLQGELFPLGIYAVPRQCSSSPVLRAVGCHRDVGLCYCTEEGISM